MGLEARDEAMPAGKKPEVKLDHADIRDPETARKVLKFVDERVGGFTQAQQTRLDTDEEARRLQQQNAQLEKAA